MRLQESNERQGGNSNSASSLHPVVDSFTQTAPHTACLLRAGVHVSSPSEVNKKFKSVYNKNKEILTGLMVLSSWMPYFSMLR